MNVLFIPTSCSSVMYWRIQGFVESAWRQDLASFQNPLWIKDLSHVQPWQEQMTDGDKYDPLFIRQFVPMIESGCVKADAVVFQYAHHEGALELFDAIKIKFPHLPVLLEIDDNILSVPVYNEAFDAFDVGAESRRRVISQLRSADGVIVSTPYLKELYTEFNAHVFVVPNAINFRQWDKLKPSRKSGVRIGWAGGSGHGGDFAIIADVLKQVLAENKTAKLVLVNGPAKNGIPDFLKGTPRIEHHATWTPILKYPKMLADMDFDIGIAPLIDSAFNRGKSNLKWLENAALGIPTVAMNVGHMSETIMNGMDGFLCEDPQEFGDILSMLISNRKMRNAIGMAANERVRKDFNIDEVTKLYISVLAEMIERKKSGDILRTGEIVGVA